MFDFIYNFFNNILTLTMILIFQFLELCFASLSSSRNPKQDSYTTHSSTPDPKENLQTPEQKNTNSKGPNELDSSPKEEYYEAWRDNPTIREKSLKHRDPKKYDRVIAIIGITDEESYNTGFWQSSLREKSGRNYQDKIKPEPLKISKSRFNQDPYFIQLYIKYNNKDINSGFEIKYKANNPRHLYIQKIKNCEQGNRTISK